MIKEGAALEDHSYIAGTRWQSFDSIAIEFYFQPGLPGLVIFF